MKILLLSIYFHSCEDSTYGLHFTRFVWGSGVWSQEQETILVGFFLWHDARYFGVWSIFCAAIRLGNFKSYVIFSKWCSRSTHDSPVCLSRVHITHSIVVFAVVFGLVWLFMKKPPFIVLGWPLHIMMDLFTHTTQFFPTPIFWPISNAHFTHGIPWSEPIIFIPNVILLIILYVNFFLIRPKQRHRLWDDDSPKSE